MGHVPDEVRAKRASVLAPLFAVLRERGIKRQWFADQLGISRNSLWNYQHGYDRLPIGLIERACQLVGIPTVFVPIPSPRDLYIQQPRSTTRKASTKRAASTQTPAKKRTATR